MTSIQPLDSFVRRHLGADSATLPILLEAVGVSSLDRLVEQTIPMDIRMDEGLDLRGLPSWPLGESEVLDRLRSMANKNRVVRSLIGQGYYDTLVPPVIQRNILENPGWYTQYTPYQAEISQGRLEALIGYQTMVADLTGLPVSNASLLDEGTAAGEAMAMAWSIGRKKRSTFLASSSCHPQTLAVLKTRAKGFGIELAVGEVTVSALDNPEIFGILLAYPATDGSLKDHSEVIAAAQSRKVVVVMATDLLALTLLQSPGELGADIAVGSAQRFGVPLGYGGPHAGFMAARDKYKRQLPGRIIGVSKDARGRQAYRMALQTREQHIRREKATSNICTAQVLLAIMAGMYGAYHGPEGLKAIARRTHLLTRALSEGLKDLGFSLSSKPFFDTLRIDVGDAAGQLMKDALKRGYNLRDLGSGSLGISLDEKSSGEEVNELLALFAGTEVPPMDADHWMEGLEVNFGKGLNRDTPFMEHHVFHAYHQEHEMLRYLNRLQSRDLSLTTSMIPLGSCTMKLNAAVEMFPITWPEFAGLHPFAPLDQAEGYSELFESLESWLAEITGFDRICLQPNAGAQGEYTGLMLIRSYHEDQGEGHRNVCLIPGSAHGTNPASAVMAGLKVVAVACDEGGNIDVGDLEAKAEKYRDYLSSIMITYPSTHGVFEESIREICHIVHRNGGQVYLDGANMNAQVGLCRPGDYGADVCHLNLHKTFAIPHGGGGPGVGPVGVLDHLAPYLPGSPVVEMGGEKSLGAVSAAPWGSAGVLPISWMYIALMGAQGLTEASKVAILNANYMVSQLEEHFDILYRGEAGRVAHELILDTRPFKKSAGIEVEDIAKRLMDYGFHSPTMSWPVPGTLMIEPTESESKEELDRFCDAMVQIRQEIRVIEEGDMEAESSPLKNAPHTLADLTDSSWDRPYTRREAVMPGAWQENHKYWPFVNRIDNVYGDRHLFCTCAPVEME